MVFDFSNYIRSLNLVTEEDSQMSRRVMQSRARQNHTQMIPLEWPMGQKSYIYQMQTLDKLYKVCLIQHRIQFV